MPTLFIDSEAKSRVATLREFAESRTLSTQDIYAIQHGRKPPPGDDPNYATIIPLGFRVVFTVEQHPFGWAEHLSVSVPDARPGSGPNEVIVNQIAQLFGFPPLPVILERIKAGQPYLIAPEDLGDGRIAVNVVVPRDRDEAAEVKNREESDSSLSS